MHIKRENRFATSRFCGLVIAKRENRLGQPEARHPPRRQRLVRGTVACGGGCAYRWPTWTPPATLIVHLTWATVSRQPAFPTEEGRRELLRDLAAVAASFVVLFAIVDDHVHIVVILKADRLRWVQGALTKVLSSRSAAPLAPPHLSPVTTRKHMNNLVGYCLGQFEHHGLADNAVTATGSCFPDLVGARRLPWGTLKITEALPRFRLQDALDALGLAGPLNPASDAEVRALGPARLVELVAAAFAAGPDLAGKAAERVLARRVSARLALDVGLRPRDLGEALGVSAVTLNRLAASPIDVADLHAARLRIALEGAGAARGRVVREPAPLPYLLESGALPAG